MFVGCNPERELRFSLRFYRNHAAVALTTLEGNYAISESEERVVRAHAYVLARIVNCTALANDDVASDARLSAPDFNTKTL